MEEKKVKKKIIIYRDWCKGCRICIAFCPKKVLILDEEEKACWKNSEDCINCGLCELRCPDVAIEMV